jgi:hypothetical protein
MQRVEVEKVVCGSSFSMLVGVVVATGGAQPIRRDGWKRSAKSPVSGVLLVLKPRALGRRAQAARAGASAGLRATPLSVSRNSSRFAFAEGPMSTKKR